VYFHRAEDPDADPTVFTMVGRDDDRLEAYYFRGRWGFDSQELLGGGSPQTVDAPDLNTKAAE
jgi:hypothetical protein